MTGGTIIHEGVLPSGVALIEADQYNGDVELQSKLVDSSELQDDGVVHLGQSTELAVVQDELTINQTPELADQVELVDPTKEEPPEGDLSVKTELQTEELVNAVEGQQDGVLVDSTEVHTGEVLAENTVLTQCTVPNQ